MHFPSASFLSTTTLFLLSAASTLAIPAPGSELLRRYPSLTGCSLDPPPSLPSSTLPPPSAGLKPVRIVLGRGVQNYMCETKSSAPQAIGADATLYDVSCLTRSEDSLRQLSRYVVPSVFSIPQDRVESFVTSRLPSAKIGVHYFREDGAPKFVFDDGLYGVMAKDDSCPAPDYARGNKYGAAVAWLRLVHKDGEPDGGIDEVYRVDTAGGKAPAQCSKKGKLSIEYAAVYWMFGKK